MSEFGQTKFDELEPEPEQFFDEPSLSLVFMQKLVLSDTLVTINLRFLSHFLTL